MITASFYCSAMGAPLLSGDSLDNRKMSTDINHPFHEIRETGSFSSVVNLTNSIIGSGILGLPYAFSTAGMSRRSRIENNTYP